MFDLKWKSLVVSIVLYQAILTWCLFDLVDTAAYLARPDCGDRCRRILFGFILTNQSGYDTALRFAGASLLLVVVNAAVWIRAALKRPGKSSGPTDTESQSSSNGTTGRGERIERPESPLPISDSR